MKKNASKSQLIVLVLLVLFSPLAIDIYLPALPKIAEVFHVKPNLAQDTIAWFLFSMGVGQLFSGPLADKYGRKKVAIAGVAIYGLSSYLASVAVSIEWLLIARVLQGLGACATSVAAFASVRDIFGKSRSGQMISYLNGVICFIPALAPILGSYLTTTFGWRSNFDFMAVYALIVALLLIVLMRETNPNIEQRAVFKLDRYFSVLSNKTFVFHALLCMMAMAVILAYVSSAPAILMSQFGLSMNEFTYWFSINALINIVAAFLAPALMRKKGSYYSLRLGITLLGISGVAMLVLTDRNTPLAFMTPIFLSSTGFALVLGSAAGKALAPFGEKAGTAAALLGLFQMSGAGLLVGTSQRLHIEPQLNIAIHMLSLVPFLLFLVHSKGRSLHEAYSN